MSGYTCQSAVVLITPSTEQAVTREEVKVWLKIEEEEVLDDPLIDSLIGTATTKREAFTGVVALKQTYDYVMDDVPYLDPIVIPRSPLVSVTSIKGYGTSDVTDTGGTAMSTSDFYVDTAHEPGRIVPTGTAAYPTASRFINAFIIRFTAGYSSQTTGVPDTIKTDLKNIIAAAYEHRGDELEMNRAMDRVLIESDAYLPEWG